MSSGYLVFYCNIFYNVIFICILFRIIACFIGLSIENCPYIEVYNQPLAIVFPKKEKIFVSAATVRLAGFYVILGKR